MAKAKNSFEELARKGAERIEKARAHNTQLTFLPDEAGTSPVDTLDRKAGRPKGAQNKGSSELRKWLAANGYKMPEDILAQMAGLDSGDPAIIRAMEQTEILLAWAYQDAKHLGGAKDGQPMVASPAQKLAVFNTLYTIMLRAADALLPYGTPKAAPDAAPLLAVPVFAVPAAPAAPQDPAALARDVTPRMPGRMVPADVRHKIEQNQALSKSADENSDAEIRTQEASD